MAVHIRVGVWRILATHLPEVGKGSGNPAPKLVNRWDDGVAFARCVRRVNEERWSEDELNAVAETTEAEDDNI